MKILTKKEYNKIINDFEKLKKQCRELEEKLEDKKTSCKLNKGKDFCFNCKNSFRYKTYFGVNEIEACGCLLDVPCESFEMKGAENEN